MSKGIPFEALFSMPPALQQDMIGNHRGYYPLRQRDRVLGRRVSIDNSRVDLWEGPTDVYVFPAAGQQLYVKSSSPLDTANGTGARTVHAHLLDDAYAPIDASLSAVALNGNTPVAIGPANGLRINHFHITTSGNLGTCAGNLSITDSTGNITYSFMSAGTNFARQAIYTTPAGYIGYISGWRASSGSSSGNHQTIMTLRGTTHDGRLWPGQFLAIDELSTQDGGESYNFPIPIPVPAMCDVKVSAISDTGSANVTACAMIMGWVEPA